MNAPLRMVPPTYTSIAAALPTLTKGQKLIYHVGSLMFDRLQGPTFATVHGAAIAAYEAYQRGEVTLVQRKIGPGQFQYIAIRL